MSPRIPSGSPEVIIERRGYVSERVLVDGFSIPSVCRIEVIDDAQDAPMVQITLYARCWYRDLDPADERPHVVAGQLPLDETT